MSVYRESCIHYWLVLLFFFLIYFSLISVLKFANFILGYIGNTFVIVSS